MFTVCPKCTLTLVVTTVDLRAGQGYVRCGRCANVFNALIALREGEPTPPVPATSGDRKIEPAHGSGVAMEPDPEPAPEPAPEPEPEPEPEAEQPLVEEIELTGEEPAPPAETEAAAEEASLEFDAAATDVSEIFISPAEAEHDTGSGSYEAVVLAEEPQAEAPPQEPEPAEPAYTDTVVADDWSLLDDSDAPEYAAANDSQVVEALPEPEEVTLAEEPVEEAAPAEKTPAQIVAEADAAWVQEMFAEAEAEAERSRTAERATLAEPLEEPAPAAAETESATESAAAHEAALAPLITPAQPRRPSWQYIAAVAGLALLLVLQIIHHNRQSLVLHSSLGPAVSSVYGWFGVTLVPRWDLSAYSVKQLGAEAEGGEGTRLRVRLSLQNESTRVQPLPLLRLTLQDRYGNAVATRDLEPKDYLPKRVADQRLLEPDQRIDAELHVIDPGRAAIGFEIDACLQAQNGSIGCANEARRRAAG